MIPATSLREASILMMKSFRQEKAAMMKTYKKYEKTKNDYDENVVISTPDNAATAAPDDSDVLDSFKDDGEPDDEPLEEED